MLPAFEAVAGADNGLLILCDHASAAVPAGIDLGIPAAVMRSHIAVDLGAAALSRALALRLGCPAILGRWSRLVADVNRAIDAPGLAPAISDGVSVPGNASLEGAALAVRRAIHRDFHDAVAAQIVAKRPRLVISVHSFTPVLASDPAPRPWPIAVLWNRDDRAALLALSWLKGQAGLDGPVGANQPYSGRNLNYTVDTHAEAHQIANLGLEIRQDMIADGAGVARYAALIAACVAHVDTALAGAA